MTHRKNKHRPQHQINHSHAKPQPQSHNAAVALAVFIGMLGLAVAFFSNGPNLLWMAVGVTAGALLGFILGNSIDKAAARK
ncbi:hypothetical protein [Solitalea koreensis]|uniref:Glycine zipper n=1 Tax=Solitalea koreensis TaxID=543615 RepID=A0A521C4X3_9SPHI|nr:hypothetical protein [Solitalea koreensis]SMO54472.1 hypothetical protein SAMN06265350_103217 [Solitalea koreensis]